MISLSLCMIVKNEEAVLERILKPVSQVMDAILIADTGSSDRTKEIAEQYTSQVFDFPWCDDFSAPRNFLLEKVRTDYWMWLDADDMITQENLYRLKQVEFSFLTPLLLLCKLLSHEKKLLSTVPHHKCISCHEVLEFIPF